ncbi:MAG: hypothetical protein GY909_02165 [Oligoflexia bacterium]|nr:hypothetical protein [Oligoflexia bacterium]
MKITLFYKHATVLDYAYLDDHKGVVGGALIVNAEFIGETDEEGVVYDFSYAKKKVKEIIDRECDHRLVAPAHLVETKDGISKIEYRYGFNEELMTYECPEEGICVIPYAQVTKANLQTHLENLILKEMPKTVNAIKIDLVEETLPEGKAVFHYTHGLKEHYGNCQRLFHGHQNTVDVFINGEQQPELENHLAKDLFKGNVHFCLWDNVANKEEVLKYTEEGEVPIGRYPEIPQVEIEYESKQGVFKGSLPGRAIYFLDEESTVENLSIHFAKYVKATCDIDDIVTVRAYEGIAKGSITTL